MTPRNIVPGTQGYAEQAEELIPRYEADPFELKHQAVLHLIPTSPSLILDVGAGTGADAAWLVGQGHTVVAVEPTRRFREAAADLHPRSRIEWIDDSLPSLATVRAGPALFNVILLTAVWMHLDVAERVVGMATLASLLAPSGVIIMSLRHGPVPDGRRMFKVSGQETVELAAASGLRCILNVQTESLSAINQAAGIRWTRLAFTRDRKQRADNAAHA